MNDEVYKALNKAWFMEPGAYVLVDGSFGSTGKGLIAAALAECFWNRVHIAVSNAGPNSGHTSYFEDERIVLKQLPTFSVTAHKCSPGAEPVLTFLSAGAVVNLTVLEAEVTKHGMHRVVIHPAAAIIDDTMIEADHANVFNIASTGQGVGPALERKLRRVPEAVFCHISDVWVSPPYDLHNKVCFLEVPQGFSLGLNQGFYPHCTTRECTVSQALSDAGLPPSAHRKTIMTVRTFPIRVGNTNNSSGNCYPDQHEITWEQLGVPPEMTTVTGRMRRVFTWSEIQFKEALKVNAPDVIALTFCDYLKKPGELDEFVDNLLGTYLQVMHKDPEALLLSFGPRSEDIKVLE